MKKKRLYLIFSLVLTISISFLAFFAPTVASASGETQMDITSNYIYNLPSVTVSVGGIAMPLTIPNIFVCFDSSRIFQCIYTPYITSTRNNLRYQRQEFSFSNGVFISQFTLSTYYNNSTNTNSYNYKNIVVNAKRAYVRPSTDFLNFSTGQFTITTSTVNGSGFYTCAYILTDTSGSYFRLEFDIEQSSTMLFNYSFTFSPISFVGGLTGENYQVGYEKGYEYGYENGERYGYENGLRDGGTLTNQSFVSLITAVVDVPINSFKSLLNFNLLGIDLLDFVLSVITFLLVLKICSLFMG